MVLIYLKNEECVEVPEAVRVEKHDGRVWCRDAQGEVVRSFDADDVALYTADPVMVEIVQEEVCDDDKPADEVAKRRPV